MCCFVFVMVIKMVNVNLFFNHGGEWIRESHFLYAKKRIHYWREYDPDFLSFIDVVKFVEYDSDELESLATQKKRSVTENLNDFRELVKGMIFKDIPEARRYCRLYSMINKVELVVEKSDTVRVRYSCAAVGCFICHITGDGITVGGKLQDNPKYKVKEMRGDLLRVFELNASEGKCKKAKRAVLEIIEGSFTNNYNKLEAYANELRESNFESDVVINLSKEAQNQVRDTQFWNVDPSKAMEPPDMVKLAGRSKVKRDRGKDEALKRQGE
ncbi:hypothetical protein RND71_016350 [Anisodus tanguticus]|uniref:Uncharacterized protein n=1 Tax=Anisodus tanguticus TaxID=243964 RepID=A0AAE1S8C9_9SOLA|nr:hypothetical protein RND71_016350 [Anisodus tanguticus]